MTYFIDDDGEDWEEFEFDPDDPGAPCAGQSCEALDCHHDDCFLRRRVMGYPDMRWPEGVPEEPMSQKVSDGLAWLMTEEGQAEALLDRWVPTGGAGGSNMEDFSAFLEARERFDGPS